MKIVRMLLAASAMMMAPMIAQTASAQSLVANGGFETGNLASWSGNGAFANNASYDEGVHSGNYAAFFGQVGSLSSISQIINTTAGQLYNFNFYFASDGGTPNEFQAYFGNTQVFESLNAPAFGYTLESFDVLATAAQTTLTFAGRNDPSYQALDDVSVTPIAAAVPEPATWAMMILGMGAIGFSMRSAKRRSDRKFDAKIKRITEGALA